LLMIELISPSPSRFADPMQTWAHQTASPPVPSLMHAQSLPVVADHRIIAQDTDFFLLRYPLDLINIRLFLWLALAACATPASALRLNFAKSSYAPISVIAEIPYPLYCAIK